jgi:hypothetical protein
MVSSPAASFFNIRSNSTKTQPVELSKRDRSRALDGKLPFMNDERRSETVDRRARRRGGRRDGDNGKPWYLRRRLWLAAATLVYVGWRRMRALGSPADRTSSGNNSNVAA